MPNCCDCLHKGSEHNWRFPACSLCVRENRCFLCGGGKRVWCKECERRKKQRRLRGACLYPGCPCDRYIALTDEPRPVNRYIGRARH
jgi:hypothetical protein